MPVRKATSPSSSSVVPQESTLTQEQREQLALDAFSAKISYDTAVRNLKSRYNHWRMLHDSLKRDQATLEKKLREITLLESEEKNVQTVLETLLSERVSITELTSDTADRATKLGQQITEKQNKLKEIERNLAWQKRYPPQLRENVVSRQNSFDEYTRTTLVPSEKEYQTQRRKYIQARSKAANFTDLPEAEAPLTRPKLE
jgi:chromosome segregation ATPase